MTIVNRKRVHWITAALLVLVTGGQTRNAQSVSIYSAIVGTATDASGAAVPDAKVTATHVATNSSVRFTV